MALTRIKNTAITLDAAEIPNISADIITSGTLADARISSSSVVQHSPETDLQPIKADITALALREATNEASAAFNLPGQFIDTFATDVVGTKTEITWTAGYISTGVASSAYQDVTTNWHSASPAIVISDSGMPQSGGSSQAYLMDGSNISPAGYNSNSQEGMLGAGSGTINAGAYLQVDFGVGAAHKIQGYRGFEQGTGDSWGGEAWTIQISTDGSSWTTPTLDGYTNGSIRMQKGVSATVNSTSVYQTIYNFTDNLNTTSRYFRFYRSGGGTSSTATWLKQMNFKMSTGSVTASGTAIQAANAVGSAKTKVGGTMLYKDLSGTATIGTDLKIYFTCDGGSNWTEAASYNAITPVYSTGVKQVRLGETTCTSGTDIRYKIEWANQADGSKQGDIHGIGINY